VALAGRAGDGSISFAFELIAEVLVQLAEVVGQIDRRGAVGVEDDVAVVHVHHVRGLDKRVRQPLVVRIERVVDLERAGRLRQRAVDVRVALREHGVAGVGVGLREHRVVLSARRRRFDVKRERRCLRPDADVVRVTTDACGPGIVAVHAVHATGAVNRVAVHVAGGAGDALGAAGAVDPGAAPAVEPVRATRPVDAVGVAGPVDPVAVPEGVEAMLPLLEATKMPP